MNKRYLLTEGRTLKVTCVLQLTVFVSVLSAGDDLTSRVNEGPGFGLQNAIRWHGDRLARRERQGNGRDQPQLVKMPAKFKRFPVFWLYDKRGDFIMQHKWFLCIQCEWILQAHTFSMESWQYSVVKRQMKEVVSKVECIQSRYFDKEGSIAAPWTSKQ